MPFASTRRVRLLHAVSAALTTAAVLIGTPAAADTTKTDTGMDGDNPRIAVGADESLHMVFYAGGEIHHARLASGAWGADTTVPDSGGSSKGKGNQASLALDPSSKPHVVWGPPMQWTDAANHSRGVWYWDGTGTTQIFDEYTEYLSIGISTQGDKMVAAAVVFLPGDTVGRGVAWAPLNGSTLGTFARFAMNENEGKYVRFCAGADSSLHLVWRWSRVHYVRWASGAWSDMDKIATSPSSAEVPSCVVDPGGNPHVAWLMWKDNGGGSWSPLDIRYASKAGGAWSPSTDGEQLRVLSNGGSSPNVAVDGAGRVVVVWSEGASLFASVSGDGGESFASPAVVLDDLEPADDNGTNQPTTPIVFRAGQFEGIYKRNDGALVHYVLDLTQPGADAGPPDGAAPDASAQDGGTPEGSVADAVAHGDANADGAGGSKTDGGTKYVPVDPGGADGDGGCGCNAPGSDPKWGITGAGLLLAALTLCGTTRRRARRTAAKRDE